MSQNRIRFSKNIDSILQVTNEVIHKNNNYRDYIINQNNSLYMRQLPLLMKNERIKALIHKKLDDSQKNASTIIEEEKDKDKEIVSLKKLLSPLNNIRNIKIKSKKLPPLCPLYNERGELIPSAIRSSKVLYKKIDYSDFLNRMNFGLGLPIRGKPILKKMEIKKLKYNKSCDFDLKIRLDDLENNYFNKPEYEYLTYDENEIFGKDNISSYEEIIKNKIIELQTTYNKNDTITKKKIYQYGFDKRKIVLTLDSLKIKIYEIKKEDAPILERKSDIPYFEYTLPFALLPLFYFKGIDSFLFILTKIITFKENNLKFELEEKSDQIIGKILKNCTDFDINDNNAEGDFNPNEKEIYINDTDMNNGEMRSFSKQNSFIKKNNNNNSFVLNSEIKTTQFNNTLTTSINNQNEINNNNSTIEQNSTNNLNTVNINSNTNNNQNTNKPNDIRKTTTVFSNKNIIIKSFDIYASKQKRNESKIISQYEYFWITPAKSFILAIETPLITIFAPSNNNLIKQYIHFELLFYIYKNNFIMWDFYIMKYLSSFKDFRVFFEQLYSIPKKMNSSSFLTLPKKKKILSTNYELTSIITRPLSEKKKKTEKTLRVGGNKNYNKSDSPKTIKKFESSKTKNFGNISFNSSSNKNIFTIKDNNEGSNINKSRYSKQIDNNFSNNALNKSLKSSSNANSPTNKNNNDNDLNANNTNNTNTSNNNNLSTYNSVFVQKGLLFIVSLINEEREIMNEFTIHFNVDQLRKFQVMEIMQDKMSYFLKFMIINYDTEKISFDFDSFKELNEMNWITEINKYNYNYLSQHKTISEEKFLDENGQDLRTVKILKGLKGNIKIKVEMKCPLIIMQDLDDLGFKVTERVNVDYDVEKILSKISIHNSLDLTKQLIGILKDNNFCRKIVTTNRTFKKKTTKKKISFIKENKLMTKKQTNILGIIADLKED